jgi:hypothetical protein
MQQIANCKLQIEIERNACKASLIGKPREVPHTTKAHESNLYQRFRV